MEAFLAQAFNTMYVDLVQGNKYAWFLFAIGLFGVIWKVNSNIIRSIYFGIKGLFFKKKTHDHTKQIMEAIIAEVASAYDAEYSTDRGRNSLYRWIVWHNFNVLKDGIQTCYEDYRLGKISPDTFCSPAKHRSILEKARQLFRDDFIRELRQNKWPETKIAIMREMTTVWFSEHTRLFDKYLSICTIPRQFMQHWLWLICETIMSSSRYGIQLNGEITGLRFNGLKIGDVHDGRGQDTNTRHGTHSGKHKPSKRRATNTNGDKPGKANS